MSRWPVDQRDPGRRRDDSQRALTSPRPREGMAAALAAAARRGLSFLGPRPGVARHRPRDPAPVRYQQQGTGPRPRGLSRSTMICGLPLDISACPVYSVLLKAPEPSLPSGKRPGLRPSWGMAGRGQPTRGGLRDRRLVVPLGRAETVASAPNRSSTSATCLARLTTRTPAAAKRLTAPVTLLSWWVTTPPPAALVAAASAGALFKSAFGYDSAHTRDPGAKGQARASRAASGRIGQPGGCPVDA